MRAAAGLAAALGFAGAPQAAAYPALGPYMPATNVHEHAQIMEDVTEMFGKLAGDAPDYAAAKLVYTQGGGASCKSPTTPRTLQGFATKDLAGESFYDAFMDAGFKPGFWDTELLSALDGNGMFAGLSRTKRVTCLKKGVLGLVTYYASHELEAALVKGRDATKRANGDAAHAWDEGWAFYYGSQQGSDSPWEVATKRDTDFPDGSNVSFGIVPHFNRGLVAMRDGTYDDTAGTEAMHAIYLMWAVTYLRAALKYLQVAENSYSDKAHSEGYAYYMAIDGWVHSKSPAAAEALRDALAINQTKIPQGTFCAAKQTLEAAYPAIGLDCSMMGAYKDQASQGVECSSTCSAEAAPPLPEGASAIEEVEGTATDVTCEPGTTQDGSSDVSGSRGRAAPWAAAAACAWAAAW